MSKTRKSIIKKVIKKIPVGLLKIIPDKLYVRMFYFYAYGKFPNLKKPATFDEKIQWYKLYYRKPEMTSIADKYEARKYVEKKGLGHILNELYFVKDYIDESDFTGLPDTYVIKVTHGCGMNVINNGKRVCDIKKSVVSINKWLKYNHFNHGREWAYKNIKPRVICEKYLVNKEAGELIDYKFYCYSGKPEVLFVCKGRFSDNGVKYNAYDMDWNRIYTFKGRPGLETEFVKPGNFEEMKKTAKILCGDYPFIRVDLYSVDNHIYFSELTFYPDSGIVPFSPDKYNYYFGNLFKLPKKINNT